MRRAWHRNHYHSAAAAADTTVVKVLQGAVKNSFQSQRLWVRVTSGRNARYWVEKLCLSRRWWREYRLCGPSTRSRAGWGSGLHVSRDEELRRCSYAGRRRLSRMSRAGHCTGGLDSLCEVQSGCAGCSRRHHHCPQAGGNSRSYASNEHAGYGAFLGNCLDLARGKPHHLAEGLDIACKIYLGDLLGYYRRYCRIRCRTDPQYGCGAWCSVREIALLHDSCHALEGSSFGFACERRYRPSLP